MNCEFPRDKIILFKDLFLNQIYSGQTVSISINNMKLDIDRKMTTKTWKMTIYTADGYKIDTIQQGLTLDFPCQPPCKTCADTNPEICYSCNPYSGMTVFHKNLCLSQCPFGMYNLDGNCEPCDPSCMTCS